MVDTYPAYPKDGKDICLWIPVDSKTLQKREQCPFRHLQGGKLRYEEVKSCCQDQSVGPADQIIELNIQASSKLQHIAFI